ncbi:MAG: hypothetical protein JWN30_1231 [Bacilli bacterium]|nr:hypothetical protein [Bacilli bacterium]
MNGIPRPLVRVYQAVIFLFAVWAMVSGIYTLLLVPFLIGVHSLVTRRNLLFKLLRPLLKKPLNEYYLEDPDQQRFNQWIAVICLGLSWIFFMLGLKLYGYIFGGMVALASAVAICGFCIGCFLRYRYLMWKHQRQSSI